MHITLSEIDETAIRLAAVLCATFIAGEGSDNEQRVLGIAAVLSEFIDEGSVTIRQEP